MAPSRQRARLPASPSGGRNGYKRHVVWECRAYTNLRLGHTDGASPQAELHTRKRTAQPTTPTTLCPCAAPCWGPLLGPGGGPWAQAASLGFSTLDPELGNCLWPLLRTQIQSGELYPQKGYRHKNNHRAIFIDKTSNTKSNSTAFSLVLREPVKSLWPQHRQTETESKFQRPGAASGSGSPRRTCVFGGTLLRRGPTWSS